MASAAPGLEGDLEALLADREMAALFIPEVREHLAAIETLVLQIEHTSDRRPLIDALYRAFHTIKGNAVAIGAKVIGRDAHAVESLLDIVRGDRKPFDAHDVDAILETVDRLREMLDTLARGLHNPTSASGPREDRIPIEEPSTIKVDTRRLDTLVDMVGELMILQSMLRERCTPLVTVDEPTARQFAMAERLLSDLQRVSLSMRMVSLRRTFRRVGRVVRDLSHTCAKPADLVIAGESIELDRHVIEQIADPLLHLVRNAIDHGLEDPSTRAKSGKPSQARIELCASHRDAQVCIEVRDDGRGIDLQGVRTRAIALGLLAENEPCSPAQLCELIFEPGISTAGSVTDLSGRGVGLDVVRRNVQALGGRVEVRTTQGRGTTFTLKVPLTMAILKGVIVRAAGERFVLPAHVLREVLRREDCEAHRGPEGEPFVSIRGIAMPMVDLGRLLGKPADAGVDANVLLVIDVDGRRAALLAAAVFGVQEFVAKPLKTLEQARGFSGGTVLGDGSIGLILDAAGLFDLIDAAARAAA